MCITLHFLILKRICLFCCPFSQFGEIFLELFTIPSGLHLPEKFCIICKLGHLTAYPCLQVICEQVEKHRSQARSLGHTAFHFSIVKIVTSHLLFISWFSTCPSYPLTVEFSQQPLVRDHVKCSLQKTVPNTPPSAAG